MQRLWCVALFLTFAASAQTSTQVFWDPPDWNFPQETKATVAKEMLNTLRVSKVGITLEETRLDKVGQLLGGEVGAKGDAGDAMRWLCFHGTDSRRDWILWLESGEIDGGRIGSFQWRTMPGGAKADRRCRALSGAAPVTLGLPLKLGMTEAGQRGKCFRPR